MPLDQATRLARLYPGSIVQKVEDGIVYLQTPAGVIRLHENGLMPVASGDFHCTRNRPSAGHGPMPER